MIHLPAFIEDLGLILAAAGIVTLLFKRFRQPIVLGYIIAGFLVGPHFTFFPTITDNENVKVWAEIGIIFLLFGLGLEFSFKKLARVGNAATVTATVEVLAMATIGYFTGRFFGWSVMDSLFLGGILSISSTTIIIRAFEEAGVKGRGFVSLVFGVLVVEDLIAILLLVLLSTIAISQSFAGSELALALAKLAFFLMVWFLSGIFLLPTLLNRLRAYLTSETLLVLSLGLCFLMVILTTHAGFSPALGAFMMGSILSETREGKRIEHLIDPVKNLFAAIFFVSVGMLIDPFILMKYMGPIIVITLITIFGKALSTALGVLLSGRSLRHAVQSGLSLAQIGEFSFIIAVLGVSLKVTSDFLYPIAVGVSAVTTFTTPYMIKSADYVFHAIDKRLPSKWQKFLSDYAHTISSVSFLSAWSTMSRTYSLRMTVNAVIVAAIFLGISQVSHLANSAGLILAVLLSAPFFWAMVMSHAKIKQNPKLNIQYTEKKTNRVAAMAFEVFRWLAGVLLLSALSTKFIELKFAIAVTVASGMILLFIFSRQLEKLYARLENRFVKNFSNQNESSSATLPALAPWEGHLEALEVEPSSEIAGKTLEQLNIRKKFGITIALIERGRKKIPAPNGSEMIFPYDKIFVIGTDEEIIRFKNVVEKDRFSELEIDEEINYMLKSFKIYEASGYLGRTIRDSGIREKSKGLVVGIERNGKHILNPSSQTKIELNDLIWLVGERSALKNL